MMNPWLHKELIAEKELHLLRRAEQAMLVADGRIARRDERTGLVADGRIARRDERTGLAALLRRRRRSAVAGPAVAGAITIRWAFPDDAQAVARLAALDSCELPAGQLLVAEVDGEPWAALSLTDGRTVADPFKATAGLIELLEARAAQLWAAADEDGARGLESVRGARYAQLSIAGVRTRRDVPPDR